MQNRLINCQLIPSLPDYDCTCLFLRFPYLFNLELLSSVQIYNSEIKIDF